MNERDDDIIIADARGFIWNVFVISRMNSIVQCDLIFINETYVLVFYKKIRK